MKRKTKLPDSLPDKQAYRGYLICPASLDGSAYTVQKEGFTICHGRTVENCKASIDGLLDPEEEWKL